MFQEAQFHSVFERLAENGKTKIESLLLTLYDRRIYPEDTPELIELTVVDFIGKSCCVSFLSGLLNTTKGRMHQRRFFSDYLDDNPRIKSSFFMHQKRFSSTVDYPWIKS